MFLMSHKYPVAVPGVNGDFFFFFFFFFNVRAYLGINSMKLKTNGIDHIVTADKYTPR